MANYIAKRVRLRNGERLSVLSVAYGLPVHEVTLYLDSFRKKGRAANTIHFVCCTLVLLYRELDRAKINLMERLEEGRFLTTPELDRLASLSQMRMADVDDDARRRSKSNLISMSHISLRLKADEFQWAVVDIGTQATRLRYMAGFLAFWLLSLGMSHRLLVQRYGHGLKRRARTRWQHSTHRSQLFQSERSWGLGLGLA